jgi:CBS domain-containing protein
MRLRQLMTPPLLTASADQLVGQVIHAMNELRVRSVPVLDAQGRVMGMLCQRDLYERPTLDASGHPCAAPPESTLARLPVSAIMRRSVPCAREEDALSEAAWWMVDYGLDVLPVTREGVLVGVVSRADLIRLLAPTV